MTEYKVFMEYQAWGACLTMVEYLNANSADEAVETVWEHFIEKFARFLSPDDLDDVKVEVCQSSD